MVLNHNIIESSIRKFIQRNLNYMKNQLLKNLKKIININNNYKFLKIKIRNAEPPSVPALNVLTRELTQIDYLEDDFIIDKSGNKMWNMDKLEIVAGYVEDIYRMR